MTTRADYTRNLAARFPLTPAPDDSARRSEVSSGELSMLWYSPETRLWLAERIGKAVEFFKSKYDAQARTVYVSPTLLPDGPIIIDGVIVLPSVTVMPMNFFVSAKETK